MTGEPPAAEVGLIGLGTMGGQMARHLLAAGYAVVGRDTDTAAADAFAAAGGTLAASPAEVAATAGTVIVSLPSVASFEEVTEGANGLRAGARAGQAVIETSTLPLAVKERAHRSLAECGVTLLDCPLSGTGAQMAAKDIVVYASGDEAALARVEPILATFSRARAGLGAFGNGTKLKLVANLLVTIHNVSAAEALLVAERAGLDLQVVLPALAAGAGTSRMLEVRGPLMLDGHYSDPSMRVRTFLKDVGIITGFAYGLNCPTPLFSAAAQVHLAALAEGHGNDDTASVFAVLRLLAGETTEDGPP